MTDALHILAQVTQPAQQDALVDLYVRSLRTPLITASFTLTALSLSLGAFVWLKVKENIYDKPEYQERVRALRAFNPKLSAYGPVFRFLYISLATGVMLFASGLLHLTAGMTERRGLVIICLLSGGLAFAMMFATLVLAGVNAVAWHRFSEQTAVANKPKTPAHA